MNEGLTVDLYFWDLMVSTGYGNKTRPFLGPLSLAADTVVRFYEDDCMTPLTVPRVVATVTLEHVPVLFGQEHVKCLHVFRKSLEVLVAFFLCVWKRNKFDVFLNKYGNSFADVNILNDSILF